MSRKPSLYTKTVVAQNINIETVKQMHHLFIDYYNNAGFETFIKDLNQKDHVILVYENIHHRVVGFTTIKKFETRYCSQKVTGIFSGDTIMYKDFWGSKAIHNAFLSYMVKAKLKNPSTPLYWFLISKGYKTYLLMANNFLQYYPKLKGSRKSQKYLEGLTQHFCEMSYPGTYNKDTKILDFGQAYQSLKSEVAEITPELKATYPKINYFEELNPLWREGKELPCVGEITFDLFTHYGLKRSRSFLGKVFGKAGTRAPARI